jgi:hypothetical protein
VGITLRDSALHILMSHLRLQLGARASPDNSQEYFTGEPRATDIVPVP